MSQCGKKATPAPNLKSAVTNGSDESFSKHGTERQRAALAFLQRYHDDGNEFLDRIVTVMRLGFCTSPRKPSSNQCIGGIVDLRSGENSNRHCRYGKRCARCSGTGRTFCSLTSFHVVKLNADRYLKQCGNCDEPLKKGVECLLQVCARPHTARRTAAVLTDFVWELFDQPPTALILLPAIYTFSCTSRNSCPLW
ncbi:hypothetical protein TNCV_3770041 [Trichonephila clavipes]|nr:hypothetical protein TNCV_3770041 [Trichonephila clavipes]